MPSISIERLNGVSTSVAVKAPCRVATTANITLSGTQTIDGVAVVADDRVLVKNQTDTTQNGIYTASATDWARSPDFDGSRDVVTGTLVYIVAGTTLSGSFWQVSTTGDPTPGEAMAFSQSNLSLAGISSFWQGILALTSTAGSLSALGISTFMQTVLDDSSAVNARQTLGFPAGSSIGDGLVTLSTAGVPVGSSLVRLSTAAILRGHGSLPNLTTSTAVTLASSDAGTVVVLGASATCTVVAPSSTSTGLPLGFQCALSQRSTASILISVQAAQTLLSKSGRNVITGQHSMATLFQQSSTSWLLAGDIST